jgi:hypothetical protein
MFEQWVLENYLFLEATESQVRLEKLRPAWAQAVETLRSELGNLPFKFVNPLTKQRLLTEATFQINSLLNQHEQISIDLASNLEVSGFSNTNKNLVLLGQQEFGFQHVVDPLKPILVKAWKSHAVLVYQDLKKAIDSLPNASNFQVASDNIVSTLENSLNVHAWRATRIVRTEASHSYHSGMLQRILVNPGALWKVLTNIKSDRLEKRDPLERFTWECPDGFYAPPSHPNSKLTMVAVLKV